MAVSRDGNKCINVLHEHYFSFAGALMAVIYALRQGAPSSPAVAGAVGGLLAGAIGASVFAMHCTNDSPLFVAIWYVLAIAFMSMLGLAVGRQVLHW